MRERGRILDNLEGLYREAFRKTEESRDEEAAARLDFDFQRDQLQLEVLLDLRDLLLAMGTASAGEGKSSSSLLEKARALRSLTRLR